MKIIIKHPEIKKAIDLVSLKAGDEKRILSQNPDIEPYWHHLVRVQNTLFSRGESDIHTLIAAVLHDSVEDEHLTLDEVRDLFGDTVTEIVNLLSESVHTDHIFSGNRDYYFERMKSYPNEDIRKRAFKIKVADRYDNLQGISFTNLDLKKQQFADEIEKYLRIFAHEVELEDLLDEGLRMMKNEIPVPDLLVELVYLPENKEIDIK